MTTLNLIQLLCVAVIFAAAATRCCACRKPATAVKGIYWYENPLVPFPPSAINTSLFTHVYYAFLTPNNTTYQLQVSNSTNTTLTNFTTTLRTMTPPVKTLLSIGGENTHATFFSLISDLTSRATFINSTIHVARAFGFDGVDLDWEFPQTSNDTDNLGRLFQEWRIAIAAEAAVTGRTQLLLTAAVYFAADFFLSDTPRTYPVASINQNVDWVNVMSYDFYGSWSNKTGAPSGLFNPAHNVSVVYGLQSWIRAGVNPQKMVIGFPLTAKTWELKDPSVNGVGAPVAGVGPGLNGAVAFFHVFDFNNQTGTNVVYDVDTMSVYSYNGSYWIGYDDPFTVTAKIGFAQALSLRGYFFWAAGLDTADWKISTQAAKAWILA